MIQDRAHHATRYSIEKVPAPSLFSSLWLGPRNPILLQLNSQMLYDKLVGNDESLTPRFPLLAFSRPDDVVFPFNDHTYNDLTTATISSSWDGLEIDGNAARLAVQVQVVPDMQNHKIPIETWI